MITTVHNRSPGSRPAQTRQPATATPTAEIAQRLIGRDYLSYSSISCYLRCPLQFYFRYCLGLTSEFIPSSLLFGSAIHSALEHHYRLLLEHSPTATVEDLLAVYREAWSENQQGSIRYAKSESEESLLQLAEKMLLAFSKSAVAHPPDSILAIEEEFKSRIVQHCPHLLGRIDLLLVGEESIDVTDFKTSRSRWSPAKVEESVPQLALYADLVKSLAIALDKPIRLQWIVLTKTKNPAVEIHRVDNYAKPSARMKAIVQRVWQAIESRCFYPAHSPFHCGSCAYSNACRAWEG